MSNRAGAMLARMKTHAAALVAILALGLSCSSGAVSGQGAPDGGTMPSDGSADACGAGKLECSGTCVDTTSDVVNCGGCGHTCGAGGACCGSICNTTASCAFSVTQVSPPYGFQNGGDYVTLTGSGFTPGMRVMLGDGRAPALVISATEARIQTPPAPPGYVDVTIASGASSATLPHAFQYALGGLTTPWQQKPMATVRGEDPGVAVMQDGRVLIAGGTTVPDSTTDALATAEIYTRDTDVVTSAANSMSGPRWQNAAVTLLDGRVLVFGGACDVDLGGCNSATLPRSADLFDPKTNSFSPSKASLSVARVYPRAVLLPDGRVFISSGNAPSVDLYDPTTDTFKTIAHTTLHQWGFVVRLRDGRVLIGGGDGGVTAAELFDPATDTFTPTGAMTQGRSMLTAHTLPDGRVLVIGGSSKSAGAVTDPLASLEVFDPTAGTFSAVAYKLSIGRTWQASALVRDGTVLVMGGYTVTGQCDSLTDSVDQIDPVKGTSTVFATLPNKNTEWNAVTLADGSVLGVGGGACGTATALPDLDFLPGSPTVIH
ncbi:MAG: IPT/TIG domain-containing protein [Polyangiales bacterium]